MQSNESLKACLKTKADIPNMQLFVSSGNTTITTQ